MASSIKKTFNMPINYANMDFDDIYAQFINFFKNNPNSPFKDYNFDGAGLSNLSEIFMYLIHYNNFYLNMGLSETSMSRATKDDSVYKLISNYNYIPNGKTPAKRNLDIKYFRNYITENSVSITVSAIPASYTKASGQIITQAGTGAEGILIDYNSSTKELYIEKTTGDFTVAGGVINNGADNATVTAVTIETDFYASDESKSFEVRFTYLDYSSGYHAIPTFREI